MKTAEIVDMSGARVNVQDMSKMIQIRNVPDEMHRALKIRAAAAGMSLSDYIKKELSWARAKARGPTKVTTQEIVDIIREHRGD
jgi:plasmid stability protein